MSFRGEREDEVGEDVPDSPPPRPLLP
jgi:hypothetical protein